MALNVKRSQPSAATRIAQDGSDTCRSCRRLRSFDLDLVTIPTPAPKTAPATSTHFVQREHPSWYSPPAAPSRSRYRFCVFQLSTPDFSIMTSNTIAAISPIKLHCSITSCCLSFSGKLSMSSALARPRSRKNPGNVRMLEMFPINCILP